MTMPDEISPYGGMTHEELINRVLQLEGEINTWRERWRSEQQQRIALEQLWTQKPKYA
jgi:hypothetical protein